jgi:hypothetical protein
MSYNPWNYGQSNPLIYSDPTGHIPCDTDEARIGTAETYVSRHTRQTGAVIEDVLNTYTAAGIAVQCFGLAGDIVATANSGKGIGQISDKQAETPYGEKVKDRKWWGKIVIRGSGLRCYLNHDGCTKCLTADEIKRMSDKEREKFEEEYELEPVHNQKAPAWAIIYMRRRIQLVYDACRDGFCTTRDRFIGMTGTPIGAQKAKMNIEPSGDYFIDLLVC